MHNYGYYQNLHTHTCYCDGMDMPEELTSDCHDKSFLKNHYKESVEYIKSCDFDSIGVMKNGTITEIKI